MRGATFLRMARHGARGHLRRGELTTEEARKRLGVSYYKLLLLINEADEDRPHLKAEKRAGMWFVREAEVARAGREYYL